MEPEAGGDLARAFPMPPPGDKPFVETSNGRGHHLAAGAKTPEGCDLEFALPDGTRFAYAPAVGAKTCARLEVDPFLRGNQFRPLHDSAACLAALISVAQGRRVEMGPESERLVIVLRGHGLVFMENGDTHKYAEGHVAVLPAGEPARLWAQGPDDVLAVVIQPKGAPAARRTLAGEIARKKGEGPGR